MMIVQQLILFVGVRMGVSVMIRPLVYAELWLEEGW